MIKHKVLLPKNLGAISPAEGMVRLDDDEAVQKYFGVGLKAIMVIRSALEKYAVKPKQILDLPCGSGRIIRFIRACFPNADIYACDVNKEAVEFCAANFQVHPVHSTGGFDGLFPKEQLFDLIWVGSLITHFPPDKTENFLEFVSQRLSRDGIAIVTSHGERVHKAMIENKRYGLKDVAKVKQDYQSAGYGYSDYPDHVGYGISVVSSDWITDAAGNLGLDTKEFIEGGWAGQDVYVFRRAEKA